MTDSTAPTGRVRGVFSTEALAWDWLDTKYLVNWEEPYRSRIRASYRVQPWTIDSGEVPPINWHSDADKAWEDIDDE